MIQQTLRCGLRSRVVLLVFALALAASLASHVSAEDGKVYPAAFCAGSLVGNPPIISVSSDGVTNTSSTYAAVLTCPVLKDIVYASSGTNEANLRYYMGSGASGYLVDFYAYSPYGTSNFLSSRSDFSGTAGYKAFTWGFQRNYSEGYNAFIVVVPPTPGARKSSIISYRVDEND